MNEDGLRKTKLSEDKNKKSKYKDSSQKIKNSRNHHHRRHGKDDPDAERYRSHKKTHSNSNRHDRERSSKRHKISKIEDRGTSNTDDDVKSLQLRKKSETRSSDRHKKHDRKTKSRSRSSDEPIDRRNRKRRKHEKESAGNRDLSSKRLKTDGKGSKNRSYLNSISVDKAKLYPLGDIRGQPPTHLLNIDDDYFAYHQQFWVYLFREKQVAFNDLSSEQAREAFQEFVKDYNAGNLESGYYLETGLPSEAYDEIKTTQHKWGLKISDREGKSLQMLHQGIRKQTEYSNKPIHDSQNATTGSKDEGIDEMPRRHVDEKDHSSTNRRVVDRRLREHVRVVEEELLGGKKDGRERQFEKKKEIGARIHGPARDREDYVQPDLSDDMIYGSGESDFRKSVAIQKQRERQIEEKKLARITELKAKEEHKQREMLKILGLSDRIAPGEKVTIRPRNDE